MPTLGSNSVHGHFTIAIAQPSVSPRRVAPRFAASQARRTASRRQEGSIADLKEGQA